MVHLFFRPEHRASMEDLHVQVRSHSRGVGTETARDFSATVPGNDVGSMGKGVVMFVVSFFGDPLDKRNVQSSTTSIFFFLGRRCSGHRSTLKRTKKNQCHDLMAWYLGILERKKLCLEKEPFLEPRCQDYLKTTSVCVCVWVWVWVCVCVSKWGFP